MTRLFHVAILIFFSSTMSAQEAEVKPIDINLDSVTYPYPVQYFHVALQGEELRMAYMDIKPANPNGRSVVLLHGKNFSGAYWQTTIAELTGKGYRVVVPDQVGFGKSDKPAHLQYSFHLLASNTRALLDTLGVKKTAVIGHSMGGMLATRFALMYPGFTEKLILEGPLGMEDYKLKVPYQTIDDWYKSELKQGYAGIKKYQQENYYGGTWKPEFDRWARLQAGVTLDKNYPLVARNSALTYDMIYTQPVLYEFELIKCPLLLIIGELDRTAVGKNLVSSDIAKTMGNFPELAKRVATKVKGAKVVELKGNGHLPHIQSFSAFITPVMQFLGSN